MAGQLTSYGFLSTLSLRRATRHIDGSPAAVCNFYPRSPCGERPTIPPRASSVFTFLSTLSLRRATGFTFCARGAGSISIHALLAESDGIQPQRAVLVAPFLSTLSLRRATCRFLRFYSPKLYFYPRSPCGERHGRKVYPYNHATISIHALLAESDQYWATRARAAQLFLSTLSLRRATDP